MRKSCHDRFVLAPNPSTLPPLARTFSPRQLRLDKDELLYKAFQRFDRDKTGFITLEDLQVGLAHVGGGKVSFWFPASIRGMPVGPKV